MNTIKIIISITSLLCFFSPTSMAQIAVNFQAEKLPTNSNIQAFEGGTCSTLTMEGEEEDSPMNLQVRVVKGKDEKLKVSLNDNDIELEKTNTNVFQCSDYVFNASGMINAYMVTGSPIPDKKEVSGSINYVDLLEVYSPISTVIELPIHVSASIVAVQTFCNPLTSQALARAQITGSLGDKTITVGGEAVVEGGFLVSENLNETKIISVKVRRGLNTIPFSLSGSLYTKSEVGAIATIGALACGSNAVASAGNSLTVNYFTGEGGSPLPDDISIIGLNTGINYINPEIGNTCADLPTPIIETNDATCREANGSATLTLEDLFKYDIEWSDGSSNSSVSNLLAGEHYVILSDNNNCSKVFPFDIEEPTAPQIYLPTDTIINNGQTILLDATDLTNAALSYEWSTGNITPSISVNEAGRYTVTVTDPNLDCQYEYIIKVISNEQYFISDGNIVTNSGLFYDDGGPFENYIDDKSYVINICPESADEYIVLEFTKVAIDISSDQDELSIFDGVSSICPLSLSVTEPATYSATTSSGGCLTVRFRATSINGSDTDLGWEALISTTTDPPEGCIMKINACDYLFTDDGGIDGYYSNDQFQMYQFCPENPSEEYISIDFYEMDIAGADILSVYDGIGVDCLVASHLVVPQQFQASTNSGGCLTVLFESNDRTSRPGWEATISCTNTSTTLPPYYCNCAINPEPANTCDKAPFLNNLEAYCIKSSIKYTADSPGNLEASFYCGAIQNNSFFRFIPTSETAEISYEKTGGTNALCGGLQLAVFSVEGPCYADYSDWNIVDCMETKRRDKRGIFELTGLSPGQEYYFMIDGSFGSECQYALEAISGIQTCKLRLQTETVECETDGSYYVSIPFTASGSMTSYKVYEYHNSFLDIDTVTLIDDGIVDQVKIGPYTAGRDYQIIVEGIVEGTTCNFTLQGSVNCVADCKPSIVDYRYECDPDNKEYYIIGDIQNGLLPISVVSSLNEIVLLPNEENSFKLGPYTNQSKGLEEIHIYNSNLCYTLDSIFLEENYMPEVDLGADILLQVNDTILLDASAGTDVNYLWSTGATSPSIRVYEAGTYTVTVTNTNGCAVHDAIEISINTGLATIEQEMPPTVFPNPGIDEITLIFPEAAKQSVVEITIYDINGNRLFSSTSNEPKLTLSTTFLPTGIYFIYTKKQDKLSIQKWIKQ